MMRDKVVNLLKNARFLHKQELLDQHKKDKTDRTKNGTIMSS